MQRRLFPVNFAKSLRTPSLKNIYERLLQAIETYEFVNGSYPKITTEIFAIMRAK